MLLTLVPLFDEKMAVCAYSFFTQRENYLLNPLLLGTAQFDGASQITGLELIQKMGIDTLSQGKEITDHQYFYFCGYYGAVRCTS